MSDNGHPQPEHGNGTALADAPREESRRGASAAGSLQDSIRADAAARGVNADGTLSGDDLATRALADALGWSFFLLKAIMIVLTIYYVFLGGYQQVQSGERAMRLWFGKIVEENGLGKVYEPGPVYGLPYPIEERITVDVTSQNVNLNNEFWFEVTQQNVGRPLDQISGGPLNPEKDGSLITGDANVVHARYRITYEIQDPVKFVENVGDNDLARQLVRSAAQRGIVHAVASTSAQEVIDGRPNKAASRALAQQSLDDLDTGIKITFFELGDDGGSIAPLLVRSAYQEVSNAENEKAAAINEARQQYNRTLSETGGEAATELYELVKRYELARELNDTAEAGELLNTLNTVFETGYMPADLGGQALGGSVAQRLNEAKSYRTEIVERVKAEANQFEALLAEYRRNPRILTNRRWQDAVDEVFNGDIERIYAPLGNLWIEAGADPEVARERERERLQEDEQRRREGRN